MADNDNVVQLNTLDPTGFRVPASDAKGHSISKTFRVMPVLSHAMMILATSTSFPYKNEAELIRHALARHVRWLESLGDVPSVSGQVDAANAVLKEDLMFEEFQELFNALRSRIQSYISRGDHQEARKLVVILRGHFDKMPEGYWRRQYERQMKEFDWLFANAPTVPLTSFSSE